jgi:hypothetical protein
MTSHPRNLVSALALLALALLPAAASAQVIRGCDGQCPQRPPIIEIPQPRVNSNQIAPQIKAIQDLSDPVLISIIPGEVVNRDALNRPPPAPQLRILGQPGTGGSPGATGPTFPKTNGMPPLGENRFIDNELLAFALRGLSPQTMNDILRRIGLTLIDQQSLGTLGVTVYKFRIDNPNMSVRDALRALQAAFPGVPLFQPNYVYVAGQQQPDAAPRAAMAASGVTPPNTPWRSSSSPTFTASSKAPTCRSPSSIPRSTPRIRTCRAWSPSVSAPWARRRSRTPTAPAWRAPSPRARR